MWICLNDGFLSVVDKTDENILVVRARRKEILESSFPNLEIVETDRNDYRYRVFCTRQELKDFLAKRVDEIDYPNFKDSVQEPDLHEMYANMWTLHYNYQFQYENDFYRPKWYDIYR